MQNEYFIQFPAERKNKWVLCYLLDDLNKKYHRLRQSSIDEELFDVVSGFEALKVCIIT